MREQRNTSDYVVHAKLKNNNILSRILARWKNVAEFCNEKGLDQGRIGDLVNLKRPALLPDGTWSVAALDLADALDCLPDDLFVEEQQTVRLRSNEAFIEMTRRQMLDARSTNPEHLVTASELKRLLFDNNGALAQQQAQVVHRRYVLDQTQQEIADAMGLSQERIRQIEHKALRVMRACKYEGRPGLGQALREIAASDGE